MSVKRYQGEFADPAPLGQPLHFDFSGKTAINRFHKAPITERLATWHPTDSSKRGIPTRELINVYQRWGEGGYGIIATGNVMVDPDQLEASGNLVIPADAPFSGERFEAYTKLADAAKKHGSLVLAQISHPGRQVFAHCKNQPISASDVQLKLNFLGHDFKTPRAMEEKDFKELIESFVHAAEYCYEAGFDGVELHGAHGYLLAQFLAFTTNKRTDQYGGSLYNRARLIFEIADAIRQRIPDKSFILGIKINSVEFQEGGFSTDDCRLLCLELEKHSFDFVELSGGTYEALAFSHQRESSKRREAFFLDFADMIVPELTKTKAIVTGGLRTVGAMVKALNIVQGVGLGRPACHEFDLPKLILAGKVQGAIDSFLDEQNYVITDVAAGAQVRLVARGKAPIDLTDPEIFAAFMKSMEIWVKENTEDRDGKLYGWADIFGVEFYPYGTPLEVKAPVVEAPAVEAPLVAA
ncbi:hypothetical protein F4820DRAFT_414517 [Hypoxylon rubiginosum]|uniref:Uncharacterized protein n=1 Tax=Hypoxylon rubiginosum TaxID=110542 RepID=A0ACB9Z6L8_9PEZI|nr:hypothetical protein F4820DRAFT_414517 [Hypoxylon rubiginosum]